MIGGDRLTGRRGLDKVAGEMEQAGAEFLAVFGVNRNCLLGYCMA
jgi:hypothetical protein